MRLFELLRDIRVMIGYLKNYIKESPFVSFRPHALLRFIFDKSKAVIIFFILLGTSRLDAEEYKRIISLGPGITESIYLLGSQERLVGVTTYCIRPPEAQKKEKVGSVIEVNLEKVFSLSPDLVLATSLTDRRVIDRLRGLGIKVEEIPLARDFSELCNNFLRLGRLLGKEKEALAIVTRAKEEISSIRKSIKDLPPKKVFIQVGSKPLFTMTGDTFVNDLIELAGGVNIARDSKTGLWSREMVVNIDPDVILITTMGVDAEAEIKEWSRFKNLKAVREGRIYTIDSYMIGSPTPLSFVEALKELVRILHEKN